jgi:hypothetical protein
MRWSQGSRGESPKWHELRAVRGRDGNPPPMTEVSAHAAGVEAARDGLDLHEIVEDGLNRYPGTIAGIARLIAAASLGWFATKRREEGAA